MLIRKPSSFEFLLGFLLLLLVGVPILDAAFYSDADADETTLVRRIAFAAIIVTAARVAWTHELRFGVVLFLGSAALLGDLVWNDPLVGVADIGFFSYLALAVMGYIFRERRVTKNVVAASLCVYILIGFLWAFFYLVLDGFEPRASFREDDLSRRDLVYFSFVTLTTLGYGDITPLSPYAKAAAMVEAIVGQIYLIVIVARLVAMSIMHEVKQN